MDSIHLSPRLAAVASFVPKGARLADIALITPIYLLIY